MSETRAHLRAAGVMIAAGGTGGHMFPALALAQELARRGYRVDLATDSRGKRFGVNFPAANIYELPSASLSFSKPMQLPSGLWRLGRGVMAAQRILAEAAPMAVIGFGGYPSLPTMAAAALRRIPTCIHEQNAVMGRANRLLAPVVSAIALTFARTEKLPARGKSRAEVTGNPVRDAVLQFAGRAYETPVAREMFRLVVFGGSQGAKLFSEVVPEAVSRLPRASLVGLSIIQQAREEDVATARAAFARTGVKATVEAFFADLPRHLAESHLVVSRAGASTIAELGVIGRPSVLVPLPHSIDNDQLLNARAFAQGGGAWVVEQKDFEADRLSALITQLRYAPNELESAARAAASFAKADAVARLADIVERIAKATAGGGGKRA